MATGTPVLERKINTLEYSVPARAISTLESDAEHNAHIRDKYRRIIDPRTKLSDLFGVAAVQENDAQTTPNASRYANNGIILKRENVQNYYATNSYEHPADTRAPINQVKQSYTPELITGARANADIFRADSELNKRLYASYSTNILANAIPEQESDDMRPTATTAQYGAGERLDNIPNSTISNVEHTVVVGKREKIIIATFISLVIALFTLVIVNSAIISSLRKDLQSAENYLGDVQSEYAQVMNDVETAKSEQTVRNFAEQNGMYFEGLED